MLTSDVDLPVEVSLTTPVGGELALLHGWTELVYTRVLNDVSRATVTLPGEDLLRDIASLPDRVDLRIRLYVQDAGWVDDFGGPVLIRRAEGAGWRWERNDMEIENFLIVAGQGDLGARAVEEVQDSESIARYGLWPAFIDASGQDSAAKLRSEGVARLREAGKPVESYTIEDVEGDTDPDRQVWTLTALSHLAHLVRRPLRPSDYNPPTTPGTYHRPSGVADSVLKQLVRRALDIPAQATGTNWRVPGLVVQADMNQGNTLSWDARFDPTLESMQKIAAAGGIDFDVVRLDDGTYELRTWPVRGLDRRLENGDRNDPIIYSPEFGYGYYDYKRPLDLGDLVTVQIPIEGGRRYDAQVTQMDVTVDDSGVVTGKPTIGPPPLDFARRLRRLTRRVGRVRKN